MDRPDRPLSVLVAVVLTLLLAGSAGAASARFAGKVRTLDPAKGVLVLEDVGPYTGRGMASVTTRTIALSPTTEYVLAGRSPEAPGFPGRFKETKGTISDVSAGAFVSVECELAGGKCTASRITIVQPG